MTPAGDDAPPAERTLPEEFSLRPDLGPDLRPDLGPDFDALVAPYLPAMRRLAAVSAVGIDPQDVVQEALLRAWRRHSTFRPDRGSLRGWLLAITADQARRLRQRRATPLWSDLSGAAGIGVPDSGADLDLRRAIEGLAPRQRQAVLLFYYVDLSVDETARLMRCAPGTVKSTLSDARVRLAEQLGDDDD